MSKHVVIDPITRIEGHLRIEAVIDENNVITEAFSSSTMFRGIETILKGRDPRDCGLLAMRICGVCTGTHYQRSIEAVEHAFDVTIPKNARLVRNLMQGALYLHDHVVHFYHLHALDFVDITKALEADPKKTVQEAQKWAKLSGQRPWKASEDEYAAVQERVTKYVKQGRLGIFGNAYWGSKAYKLTPEQNLIGLHHYLEALELQRKIAKAQAIFGGKNPHPQSIVVGGVTCVQDLKNPARIAEFKDITQLAQKFIKEAYLPDIYMAGTMYADEALAGVGGGLGNFMSYGDFRLDDLPFYESSKLFPSGIVMNKDLSKVYDLDQTKITEDVTHAWYEGTINLHPYDGVTNPSYTGLRDAMTVGPNGEEIPSKSVDDKGKYSWIKSPRYNGKAMEVGPLAGLLVSYASGNKRIKKVVDEFLAETGLPKEALFTTLGRTAARCLQTMAIIKNGPETFNTLIENLKVDQETCTTYKIDKEKEYKGRFIGDVPRGMLSHWVRIKDGVIQNYQAVVPSTWNAGPEDSRGQKGPYESNLIGLKIKDLSKPLEIIRVIHSFDPCIACAVHVMDTKGKDLGVYKLDPIYGNSCSN